MDTRYSREQLELRSATEALLADLGPRTVADLDDDGRRARLTKAAESSGWYDLRSPGEDDGPLASGVEIAIVARELGRAAADTPFFGPVTAADLARQAGLPLREGVTSVVLHPSLRDFAVLPGDLAEGVAVDCAGAARALILVDDKLVDVAIGKPTPATDLTRALAPVATGGATDARSGALLAEGAVERSRALALTITIADLIGAMEGALDTTCRYAQERQQYGVAIGSFQAVQHLLAEARVLVEGAISVAEYAAWAVDALPPEDALAAGSVAKAYCARAARTVCETAIQVHGGIGNTWECFVHVYLRRVLLSSALLGDEGHHLRALARRRLGDVRGL